jgi:hypothetical protein
MYQNFSDDELIEAYSTMIDYSGKPNLEMLSAIEKRGGIESFKRKIELNKINSAERNRITKEVYSLSSPETNLDFIKRLITSNVFSREELERLIEIKFFEHQAMLKNNAVSSKTIIVSIAAALLSCVIGAIIFILLMAFLTPMLLLAYIVPVYIINYLIIRFITKKTRSNIIVFLTTLLSTIGSIVLGVNILSLFLPAN